jgi:hypothetical protein
MSCNVTLWRVRVTILQWTQQSILCVLKSHMALSAVLAQQCCYGIFISAATIKITRAGFLSEILLAVSCSVSHHHHYHHHHHRHISVTELGHLLTRSGPTYSEISSKVCHDSFCQLGHSVSLPWVIITRHSIYFYTVSLMFQ